MTVSQTLIDQIRGKVRRRVLELPVQRGKHGELKRPVREGGVYTLKPPIPYDRYRREAEDQPTCARVVVRLIDLCETPVRTVTITVTHPPERQGEKWIVRFEKGDWRDRSDLPVFCSKDGGFTTVASRQAVPGDPELLSPFAEDLARARASAVERRIHPERESLQRQRGEVETLQRAMSNMKARELVRRAQRNLEAAERVLLSDENVHSRVSTAVAGSQGEADRPSRGALSTFPEAA